MTAPQRNSRTEDYETRCGRADGSIMAEINPHLLFATDTVAIPGAKPPVELKGARIFFPEERADVFNKLLRDHLLAA
jgi:hypothetical protein